MAVGDASKDEATAIDGTEVAADSKTSVDNAALADGVNVVGGDAGT